MTSIDVQDLLRTPYDDRHNCWWATRTAAMRAHPGMDPREFPQDESAVDEVVRGAGAEDQRVATWHKIGTEAIAATRCGDVILGNRDEDGTSYTACVVDDHACRAITATRERGTHTVRVFQLEGVLAVFRRQA